LRSSEGYSESFIKKEVYKNYSYKMKVKRQEIFYAVAAAILIGYVVSFSNLFEQTSNGWISWLLMSIGALAIISANIAVKKLVAHKKGCEAETDLWTFKRYWLWEKAHFPFPIPIWFILPLIITWLSTGRLWWLAILTFEAKPTYSRIRERWTDLTEFYIALIAAGGVYANIILAIILKACGLPQLAILSAWFAFFSIIPIAKLDGAKIFFGGDDGRLLWLFTAALTSIVLILINVAGVAATIISSIIGALILTAIYYIFIERR
jgi:Zn-dependent protease